jgi:hypothetical protein
MAFYCGRSCLTTAFQMMVAAGLNDGIPNRLFKLGFNSPHPHFICRGARGCARAPSGEPLSAYDPSLSSTDLVTRSLAA